MLILGINTNHDASAAVVKNGKIIADVAEERFTRIKHCSNMPIQSIQYCLDKADISDINDFDYIAVSSLNTDPWLETLFKVKKKKTLKTKIKEIILKQLNISVDKELPIYFPKMELKNKNKIINVEHHLSHAASAYYTDEYHEEKLVFVMDGIGDGKTTSIYKVSGNNFELLKSWGKEGGNGWAYSLVTEGLHWWHGDGEGKTMGLAPYGNSAKCEGVLDKYFPLYENGELIKEVGFTRLYTLYEGGSNQWHIEEAKEIEELTKIYGRENIAYEAQRLLEKNVSDIVFSWIKKTGIKHTGFSGGLFLNVKLNQKIWSDRSTNLTTQHIYPNSGDNGIAPGAALYQYYRNNKFKGVTLDNLYFGPEYTNDKIENTLKDFNLTYIKHNNVVEVVSQLLSEGKIIGWFQGAMESGPRALGNRSILMSPLKAENKDIINARVKFREGFRPFCPSVLYEKRNEYFLDCKDEYFMINAFNVNPDKIDKIPAVVHVDGTARPQLVKKEFNPLYWNLINRFGELTGEYVLINTSFNVLGEPIVNSPSDAIRCYFSGGIDFLVMHNFIVCKNLDQKNLLESLAS